MTLVDANVLVYAFSASMPEHARSRDWLEGELHSSAQVALPWESTAAFVRLVSNGRVFSRPVTVARAWEQVERWLAHPSVWIPTATRQHASLMSELIAGGNFSANDVPDIHLATLAISHGLKLATSDRGFTRFDGLRVIDPLRATTD